MNLIKQFLQITLIVIFLSACRTSINKENQRKNLEKNINEISNSEKNGNKVFL